MNFASRFVHKGTRRFSREREDTQYLFSRVPLESENLPIGISSRGRDEDWGAEPRKYGSSGYRQSADTNVICVKFDKLMAPSGMHTGEMTSCTCSAVLSNLSKLEKDGEDTIWKCEYCGNRNVVDLMEEEIPKTNDTTFLLKPAPCTTACGPSGTDASLVIFVVDISGSMCVTTEVQGKLNLRGDRTRSREVQSMNTDGSIQRLPSERRGVTYVSRLQGVQAAVDHQLAEMKKQYPDRRVALIAFNNEVTVYGDGTGTPTHLAGDKLDKFDEMVSAGSNLAFPKAVKETKEVLSEKVFELEEKGGTALGPAMLTAVAMASKAQGSKVILCTDGMANTGLGNLDVDEAALVESSAFYEKVAKMAVDNGVTVSLTTIKGTNCKLSQLGRVAEATNGQIDIVDPTKLTTNFGNILADRIIATKVEATLQLHKGLFFQYETTKDSVITKTMANVTKNTEITFQYGVRVQKDEKKTAKESKKEEVKKDAEAKKEAGASGGGEDVLKTEVDDLKELPFQLRITYTDLDGAEAIRVLTQVKPITEDSAKAEQDIDIGILGSHTSKISSKLAMQGLHGKGKVFRQQNVELVRRARSTATRPDGLAAIAGFVDNVRQIDEDYAPLSEDLYEEGVSDDDDELEIPPAESASTRQVMTDDMYCVIQKHSSKNSTDF